MSKEDYFIGIDVGTGSARAGIFSSSGKMASAASHPIRMWRTKTDFAEQSSDDIWNAVADSVKKALQKGSIRPDQIKGIGFDATCSLVVLDENDQPLSVTPGEDPEQNIIVWMDHRAKKEAELINATGHRVLKYVGGVISPEMQTPKLLWLKKYHPDTWNRAAHFFDLPDYLVYRATGKDTRSLCTTVCKWTYLGHEESPTAGSIGHWDDSFFDDAGLGELKANHYSKIGSVVRPLGEAVGAGLSEASAGELGLSPGTPVSVAIIDAHAGGLGLLGMAGEGDSFESTLALIGGTSSCHMAISREPSYIEGVWGPYYSAMIPGFWLNEGGQSATGSLIDHIIFSSAHAENLKSAADDQEITIYELLNRRLSQMAEEKQLEDIGYLTRDLHILPYFHGNRSPRANPSLTGVIAGLKLSSTMDDLALRYLGAIQAVAYGTRHIVETMNESGYSIRRVAMTGGGTRNELFLKMHADITGCPILLPREQEAVLLGSAVLGSVAAGQWADIETAMNRMNHSGEVIEPAGDGAAAYHQKKYNVFRKMYEHERLYHMMMQPSTS